MRLWVQSLALLSGFRIRRCRELWCGLQTRLRSLVAVALAALFGSCFSGIVVQSSVRLAGTSGASAEVSRVPASAPTAQLTVLDP